MRSERIHAIGRWIQRHGNIVGYLILTIGMVIGLWFSYQNDRRLRDESRRIDFQDCEIRRDGRDGLRTLVYRLTEGMPPDSPRYQEIIRILDETLPPLDCTSLPGEPIPMDEGEPVPLDE